MKLTKQNLDDFSDGVFLLNKFIKEEKSLDMDTKLALGNLIIHLSLIEQLLTEGGKNEQRNFGN